MCIHIYTILLRFSVNQQVPGILRFHLLFLTVPYAKLKQNGGQCTGALLTVPYVKLKQNGEQCTGV